MDAFVRLRLPDGSVDTLRPGDIIGRMWSAALRLDDPHISEAHALVSLRGEALQLLSLRRRFRVDGQPLAEVDLAPGQRLQLSPETELRVEAVEIPATVLGLEGPGLPRQVLVGTSSLLAWPHPRLVPGVQEAAAAVVWSTGEGWRLRLPGQPARALVEGDAFSAEGVELRAVAVPLARAGQARTRAGLDGPVRLVAYFDTVHLHRGEGPPVVLTGLPARLVSELVAAGAPVPWEDVARVLWPGSDERDVLRRRWDVQLVRLRDRLRDNGVRPELVRSTRVGLVELVLQPGDAVEDRT